MRPALKKIRAALSFPVDNRCKLRNYLPIGTSLGDATMSDLKLDWKRHDDGESTYAETDDGYVCNFGKLDGVSVDGYLATVYAPNWRWTYTARCPTAANAKSWCRHTIVSDRRAPLDSKSVKPFEPAPSDGPEAR